MSRLTAEALRRMMPVFEIDIYRQTEDKKEYLYDLMLVAMHKRKLTQTLLCMNELIQIVTQLQIPLNTQQMSEMYLFATYQQFENMKDTKKKIMAILNQEKKKVDPRAVAEWLFGKLEQGKIKINGHKKRIMSVNTAKRTSPDRKAERLPSLTGTSSEKLQDQLKYLIEIFEEMESERQHSGLIPISEENDDNEVEVPCANIPYDPELYNLNNSLCKLRIKAEDRLIRIIELARDDPRIRSKLQEAIERFQKGRIEANQKIGRLGALKAQERLNEKKAKEAKKMRDLQLGENDDIVRATKLHALLSLPEIKHNKLIY